MKRITVLFFFLAVLAIKSHAAEPRSLIAPHSVRFGQTQLEILTKRVEDKLNTLLFDTMLGAASTAAPTLVSLVTTGFIPDKSDGAYGVSFDADIPDRRFAITFCKRF